MDEFIELNVSFPVVIFTTVLAFALAWWLVTTLAGGLDTDGGLDTEADGLIDDLSDVLGAGGVPFSIALSILAFGAWVAALVLTATFRSLGWVGSAVTLVGAGAALASLLAGALLLRAAAKPLRPLFVTITAPALDEAMGAFATVRSPEVDADGGEVIVTSGPLRNTVLKARAQERFGRGTAVHIFARDDDGCFLVADIDPLLR